MTQLMSTGEFANAVGISDRVARKRFSARRYKGHDLPIALVENANSRHTQYLVLPMASKELKELLNVPLNNSSNPISELNEGGFGAPYSEKDYGLATMRHEIIVPILAADKHSCVRAELFKQIAEQENLSERSLREWVQAFENGGVTALLPSARSDKGKRRVLVSRLWDAQIDLPPNAKIKVADRIINEARSMVANDGTSAREVVRISSNNLARYCASEGSELARGHLQSICALNRSWAKRAKIDDFRLAYLHDKDHGTYQDKAVPRIRRNLHPLPMGLLIGDVHYVDLLVEERKEPVRVRLIAWIDASSMFVWVTPVFLPKGKGVRQEDVAESLSQVAFCPHGGIPQEYYLDNGSEYKALSGAMARLSNLADMHFNVTLAKPYSPTSKGEIEGFFNVLEGILQGLPGWIGGDRTNKKSANKGKTVAPYIKGLGTLENDIRTAVDIYNSRPQSGRLGGLSPLEMMERKIIQTGFEARIPTAEAFDMIFNRQDPKGRILSQGIIKYDAKQWHSPMLDKLPVGAHLELFIPLRTTKDRILLRFNGEKPFWAYELPTFEHGDRRGARLQAQLEKGRGAAVRELKAQVDPNISTFEMQKQQVERTAPNAPAPERWSCAIDKTSVSSLAELEAAEDAVRRADMDEFLALAGQMKREASGDTR